MKTILAVIPFLLLLHFPLLGQTDSSSFQGKQSVTRIEMHLSAFGVESDDFPTIDAVIDLVADTGHCWVSYYNPAYKDSAYRLSAEDIHNIHDLLNHTNLDSLQPSYTTLKTDQPESTTTFYTEGRKYVIDDYGLVGAYPMRSFYKIVYKLW